MMIVIFLVWWVLALIIVILFIVFVGGHFCLGHFFRWLSLDHLNLICEFDSVVASLDPWSLWLGCWCGLQREVIHQYWLLHVGNHVWRLHKGERKGRSAVYESRCLRYWQPNFWKIRAKAGAQREWIHLDWLLLYEIVVVHRHLRLWSVLILDLLKYINVTFGFAAIAKCLIKKTSNQIERLCVSLGRFMHEFTNFL